ncbi:hypothetical protein BBJ28_00019839 [Nothophytophthora sp. Chile5]|nr:hypothetical protein BBJ28_00019839 [Nothophytophthora sp. Chile5]
MKCWKENVDRRVAKSSRWHSSRVGLVQTDDAVGDSLISELREAARAAEVDERIAMWSQSLLGSLRGYEKERRLLVKLAGTGRVVQLLQRAIDTSLAVLDIRDTFTATLWRKRLQQERGERVALYEAFITNKARVMREMGDESQQLEVLTLMKHGLERFGGVLAPRELDLISATFDIVARRSGITVGRIPDWFVTSEDEWTDARKASVGDGGEEACLREVAVWKELHHPHVCKSYGASHVGKPFFIHEATNRISDKNLTWQRLLGCALGLEYVHRRGFVHQHLSVLAFRKSSLENKGMLSGLGLTRLRVTKADGGVQTPAPEPSTASDVLAFGLAILALFDLNHSSDEVEGDVPLQPRPLRQLPGDRPDYLAVEEWRLLADMCAIDPTVRANMTEVVHRMRTLANDEQRQQASSSRASDPPLELLEDVKLYIWPATGQTIEELLCDIDEMCEDFQEFNPVNRPVYVRLVDVYQQLETASGPLSVDLVEGFSEILWRFYLQLEKKAAGDYSRTATLCASRVVASRNYGLHHEIDRFILNSPVLQRTASIHQWEPTWKQARKRQQAALQACLENPPLLLDELDNKCERAEALALLQYEARDYCTLVVESTAAKEGQLDILLGERLPLWFIPPYQVEIMKHLADGSFGSVYEGQWLGANVVVKQVLTDQTERENREQFRHEVDLWFTLNHRNLIKLYGACHEGQPFFVCEHARLGTLASFAKGKCRKVVWESLWYAASGLRHLHERGIVHGDLKGNNILCTGYAFGNPVIKLADFGLSVFADRVESASDEGSLGAFRWKAPECLSGAPPTFASDIYSFGMCIIEVVTGEFPWGNSIPDEAVKFHVTQKKLLPARMATFDDTQWDLVERMCCFNPEERICVDAVFQILRSIFFGCEQIP